MQHKDLIGWYSEVLSSKKMKVEVLKDLKSGSLLLETMHIYFPKYVDLSKVYIKPKNSFEVMQNYRHLLNVFSQLGWRKIDPEKYVKQQDKDCLDLSTMIMKRLKNQKKPNDHNKSQWMSEAQPNQIEMNEESPTIQGKIKEMTGKKQRLLQKIRSIEIILNEATETKAARNLILKVLQN